MVELVFRATPHQALTILKLQQNINIYGQQYQKLLTCHAAFYYNVNKFIYLSSVTQIIILMQNKTKSQTVSAYMDITHCNSHRAAQVIRSEQVLSIRHKRTTSRLVQQTSSQILTLQNTEKQKCNGRLFKDKRPDLVLSKNFGPETICVRLVDSNHSHFNP